MVQSLLLTDGETEFADWLDRVGCVLDSETDVDFAVDRCFVAVVGVDFAAHSDVVVVEFGVDFDVVVDFAAHSDVVVVDFVVDFDVVVVDFAAEIDCGFVVVDDDYFDVDFDALLAVANLAQMICSLVVLLALQLQKSC